MSRHTAPQRTSTFAAGARGPGPQLLRTRPPRGYCCPTSCTKTAPPPPIQQSPSHNHSSGRKRSVANLSWHFNRLLRSDPPKVTGIRNDHDGNTSTLPRNVLQHTQPGRVDQGRSYRRRARCTDTAAPQTAAQLPTQHTPCTKNNNRPHWSVMQSHSKPTTGFGNNHNDNRHRSHATQRTSTSATTARGPGQRLPQTSHKASRPVHYNSLG